MIILWSGSLGSIPAGWVLCDGTNSTPDLRNRFIVAAGDTYAVGATGGSADAIVVTHTHTITDPGHTHTGSYLSGTPGASGFGPTVTAPAQFSNPVSIPTATTGITATNSSGTSGTNANLPPYYALAYIMKT
jgi:microcystin-dependent protein